jgi:hypothetical protein
VAQWWPILVATAATPPTSPPAPGRALADPDGRLGVELR